ncbi:DUF4328 domain-containing protein [Streptomyces erythrochromogenes]|uniref:DUF4328 domain-containing protein n=1 Tax=Streptomyces erythrochromogenes TaxID=285574 RepID=UPI0034453605
MPALPAGPPVPSTDAGPVVAGVRLRPAVALAIALTVLCVLSIGCSGYAVYADWTTWTLMERLVSDPGAVGDGELARGESLFLLASSVQTRALILAGVVFIIWFHLVRGNARVFAQDVDTLASGVAAGARAAAPAGLWLPYRIAATTWVSSSPLGADEGSRRFPLTLVNVWWGAFAAARVLGWCGGMAYSLAQSPGAVRLAATTMLVGDVLDIVAAVLAPLFVIRLTAMQRTRSAQRPTAAAVRP